MTTMIPELGSWTVQSACRGIVADDVWFPDRETEAVAETAHILFCGLCPVRTRCLQDAIDFNLEGIWAGTTTALRRKLKRQRNRVKCPGCLGRALEHTQSITTCVACGLEHTQSITTCVACGLSWNTEKTEEQP